MPALIAPASVASVCAVEERLRAGGGSLGFGAATGSEFGAGMMTRIWPGGGASNGSACTGVLAVGVVPRTIGSTLRSSVAAIVAGRAGLVAAVETPIVERGAAAATELVSSVVNCSAVSAVVRSAAAAGSSAVGSRPGQATRAFNLSPRLFRARLFWTRLFWASRTGRCASALPATGICRCVASRVIFAAGARSAARLVFRCAGLCADHAADAIRRDRLFAVDLRRSQSARRQPRAPARLTARAPSRLASMPGSPTASPNRRRQSAGPVWLDQIGSIRKLSRT